MVKQNELNSLYYDGSTLLLPISHITEIPLDQVNFFVTNLAAITFGNIFRIFFSHKHFSPFVRHCIQVVIGLLLAYFCYGRNLLDVLLPCLISYMMMRWFPGRPTYMAVSVGVFNMMYLLYCHAYRMRFDYGGYTLDVSGPLMIAVQKLTSLAFNLSDGLNSQAKLTTTLSLARPPSKPMSLFNKPSSGVPLTNIKTKSNLSSAANLPKIPGSILTKSIYPSRSNNLRASKTTFSSQLLPPTHSNPLLVLNKSSYFIYHPPSLLHTLSYIFSFHSFMCGPFLFFKHHLKFIDGSIYHNANSKRIPSPMRAFRIKLIKSTIFGFITVMVLPRWPPTLLTDKDFLKRSFIGKNLVIVVVSTMCRYKYYFAWTLGEASNISAGFGFNGYDERGRPKWDLIDNYDLRQTELGTSMKQFLDNWNRCTNVWLRYLIYDRTKSTMSVFVFSACWHGFYPGYMITFVSGGLFINAARRIRKIMTPIIEKRSNLRPLYNVASFVCTQLLLCYIGFPFMLLILSPTIHIYIHLYFYLHVIAILILVFTSLIPKQKRS